ncbi:sugar ABC transporter substrate-binding protein [Hahella sp. CCB-MM4]|uniref:ABC transporter substrate-binding protein n=1 Tax=Hahella sp. (strain CCB-MM4) TaxID=1926491 RepID=UPI000B9B0E46|nr:ABC transporter substrate-binding protein [Hahella sp. CCB-MM4]OZG75251.1 sugar ABC transporter substrate-binding protein [Hahella sp. CCB-MM4]
MLKHSSLTLALTASMALGAAAVQAADLVIAGRDGIYGKALEESVARYQAAHPDMDIELLKLPYGSLYEKLVISMRENAGAYDLVMIDDTWATEFMSNGWLANLEEQSGITGDFITAALDISRYPVGQGPAYSLPVVGNVAMFTYNKSLFKEFGLTRPDNWEAVKTAAKTISAKNNGTTGVVFRGQKGNPIVTGFLPLFWAHGGVIVDDGGKAHVNSDQGVQALESFLELKQYAPRGVEVYNSTEVRDAIQQRKAAMAIEVWPSWVPSMDDPDQSKVVREMEVIAAPGQVKGSSPMLGIWQMGVATDAKHDKAAREFLEFLTSAENQKQLAIDLGLPPTRRSVYTDADVVAKYRWYPNQLDALEHGKPRPRIERWNEVESILGDYLQLAMIGELDARTALDQANRKIDRALKR